MLGNQFNPLNAELNPVCHLLALLGAHPILHISKIRVKPLSVQIVSFVNCSIVSFTHHQRGFVLRKK
jgi:hypothetical protein